MVLPKPSFNGYLLMKLVGVYLLILAYYFAKLEYQRFTLKPQKSMRKMIFLLY